jgi:hypothetical protein
MKILSLVVVDVAVHAYVVNFSLLIPISEKTSKTNGAFYQQHNGDNCHNDKGDCYHHLEIFEKPFSFWPVFMSKPVEEYANGIKNRG